MKLKKLIPEDVVSAAKDKFEKGKDFNNFIIETAENSNVGEKYIELYKEVTETFKYLTWLEMYNEEYPGAMSREKYLDEKSEYETTLDSHIRNF